MSPIYLIHAKTGQAKQLKEEGAVPFSSNTFLWDQDPSMPTRIAKEKWFMLLTRLLSSICSCRTRQTNSMAIIPARPKSNLYCQIFGQWLLGIPGSIKSQT
jgi:hypothetical protein